jgi:ABC-2 type transport system permease protein
VEDEDDTYTDIAINTIENMDTVKQSFEFVYCDKSEALKGLDSGKYSMIVLFPEDFVNGVMYGKDRTIVIRTNGGQATVVSYIMKRLSQVATDIVIYSEKSLFALQDYYDEMNLPNKNSDEWNLNLEYFTRLFSRENTIVSEEVNATDDLPMNVYYFCDALVLIFLFLGLQCQNMLLKEDDGFIKKLKVAGVGPAKQFFYRFLSLLFTFYILYLIFMTGILEVMPILKNQGAVLTNDSTFLLLTKLLLASLILIPVCALISLVYELFEDASGAVLALFIIILVLGFVAGCFYPLSFLPGVIQKLSVFTVTREMFIYVSTCIYGSFSFVTFIELLLQGGIFIAIGIAIRCHRIYSK